MMVVTEAHTYRLDCGYILQFINREKIEGQFVTVVEGTTDEELLNVLINRTESFQKFFPCVENERALVGLRSALSCFNERTSNRVQKEVEETKERRKS